MLACCLSFHALLVTHAIYHAAPAIVWLLPDTFTVCFRAPIRALLFASVYALFRHRRHIYAAHARFCRYAPAMITRRDARLPRAVRDILMHADTHAVARCDKPLCRSDARRAMALCRYFSPDAAAAA